MGGVIVELDEKIVENIGIGLIFGTIEEEIFAADKFAVADEEDLNAGITIFAGEGDDVLVGVGGTDHFLFADNTINRFELVTIVSGTFKGELFGSGEHFGFDIFDDVVGFAIEEAHQLLDHVAILLLIDSADTGAIA